MKIIYQVYNDWTKKQREIIKRFGYSVDDGYSSFEFELNGNTETLAGLLDSWGVEKFVGTTFNSDEYEQSSLFVFAGIWENGFPQPESVDGYINATYDTTNYFHECGIGGAQNAPFRLKKEPKWNQRIIFELTWVYDEIFIKKDVFERSFKKQYNLDAPPVVLHKTGEIIANTVQLIIPKVDMPLKMADTPYAVCNKCNRIKYTPQLKGFPPGFEKPVSDLHIFKCSEYFGSGAAADNRIFMTGHFLSDLEKFSVRPRLWPVK